MALCYCLGGRAALAARLRSGVAPEDCPAFAVAAALVAMEGLEEAEGGGVTAFTAGDVTIRAERGGQTSRTAQALRLLAPWLKETGFAFQGVAG